MGGVFSELPDTGEGTAGPKEGVCRGYDYLHHYYYSWSILSLHPGEDSWTRGCYDHERWVYTRGAPDM